MKEYIIKQAISKLSLNTKHKFTAMFFQGLLRKTSPQLKAIGELVQDIFVQKVSLYEKTMSIEGANLAATTDILALIYGEDKEQENKNG